MNQGNSKIVYTSQDGIHPNLEKVVLKHRKTVDQRPLRQHNIDAFERMQRIIKSHPGKGLILDSCCGVGQSSINLANKFPESLVFGIDQSAHRLDKEKGEVPANCIFLRANCEDIWRLVAEHEIRFHQHFILYPNPWPKKAQFLRRWHGHPAFPLLPKISHRLELRSNWRLYLEEFDHAWKLLGMQSEAIEIIHPDSASLTLFEHKYKNSGQVVYRWQASWRSANGGIESE